MPPNFSAAYAIAFCGGLYLAGRWGWTIPFLVLAGTDLLLNIFFYSRDGFSLGAFLAAELPTLLAYVVLIGLGRSMGGKKSWWRLLGGGVLGALLFYIITNTAAWLTLPGYAKTLAGWLQAITTGLPGYPETWEFFRNTLMSGGLFTGLFVGAMKATEEREAKEETEDAAPEPDAEGEPAQADPAGK